MADENGRVLFFNEAARQLFARSDADKLELTWKELFGLDPEDTVQLQVLLEKPAADRARIPLHLDRKDGRRVWLEVDVKDDPRGRAR